MQQSHKPDLREILLVASWGLPQDKCAPLKHMIIYCKSEKLEVQQSQQEVRFDCRSDEPFLRAEKPIVYKKLIRLGPYQLQRKSNGCKCAMFNILDAFILGSSFSEADFFCHPSATCALPNCLLFVALNPSQQLLLSCL